MSDATINTQWDPQDQERGAVMSWVYNDGGRAAAGYKGSTGDYWYGSEELAEFDDDGSDAIAVVSRADEEDEA